MLPFLEKALGRLNKQRYDDLVDRLNYLYTSVILLFFAVIVTTKEQFGSPIKCWVSAEFRSSWDQYVENLCYISNTYYLPYDLTVPRSVRERDYRKIGYYQWVPFILMGQCLFFFLPHFIWRALRKFSGVNIHLIMQLCSKADLDVSDVNSKNTQILAAYISDALRLQKKFWLGFWGSIMYLFAKLLFALNACGQLFVLNKTFVSSSNVTTLWGLHAVSDLLQGRDWEQSGYFPRVTLCDVPERQLQNIHVHTVQCVLMINMLNEKIYLLLWFWFVLVSICTCLNFLCWVLTLLPSYGRYRMIRRYLKIGAFQRSLNESNLDDTVSDASTVTVRKLIKSLENRFSHGIDGTILERFTCDFLHLDGALLIRFVANHSGEMMAADLTFRLFEKFIKEQLSAQKRTTESEQQSQSRNHVSSNGFMELEPMIKNCHAEVISMLT